MGMRIGIGGSAMKQRALRICAWAGLSFLTGCAGYMPAVWQEAPASPPPPPEARLVLLLQVGSLVRAHLVDGDIVDGKVVRLTPTELAIGQDGFGRDFNRVRILDRSSLIRLEVRKQATGNALGKGFVGGMVLGLLAVAFGFALAVRNIHLS